MPEYDAALYDPPAPVVRVTLRNLQTNAEGADQHLLIDTGADATLIPQAALVSLGLQPIADVTCELIAFDGTRSVASVADLDLRVPASARFAAGLSSPIRILAYLAAIR